MLGIGTATMPDPSAARYAATQLKLFAPTIATGLPAANSPSASMRAAVATLSAPYVCAPALSTMATASSEAFFNRNSAVFKRSPKCR